MIHFCASHKGTPSIRNQHRKISMNYCKLMTNPTFHQYSSNELKRLHQIQQKFKGNCQCILAWWSCPVIPNANVNIIQQIIAERLKKCAWSQSNTAPQISNVARCRRWAQHLRIQFIHEAPRLFWGPVSAQARIFLLTSDIFNFLIVISTISHPTPWLCCISFHFIRGINFELYGSACAIKKIEIEYPC